MKPYVSQVGRDWIVIIDDRDVFTSRNRDAAFAFLHRHWRAMMDARVDAIYAAQR